MKIKYDNQLERDIIDNNSILLKYKILLIILLFIMFSLSATHKVYLLHGYAGWGKQMNLIKKTLEKDSSFSCEIFAYPSMSTDIDTIAKNLYEKILSDDVDSISFVTHSMGALVVRAMYQYLDSTTRFPHIYRIVMIAPPNQGSPVADFVSQFELLNRIGGPNLENLTTDEETGASKYPVPSCEIGIIIGTRSTPLLKGENDGLVQAEDAKLGVEQDMVFVKSLHQTLLSKKEVAKFVYNFLKNRQFH